MSKRAHQDLELRHEALRRAARAVADKLYVGPATADNSTFTYDTRLTAGDVRALKHALSGNTIS